MISTSHITDHQRFNFMQKLASDQCKDNALELPDWEQRFLASWRQSSRPSLWFTPGRRDSTDKMWRRIGIDLEFPFPLADRSNPATPAAHPGCCMYLKRDDERRLLPCNEPATKISRNGFLYCDGCAQESQKQMKRKNINMVLQPYSPSMARGGLTT